MIAPRRNEADLEDFPEALRKDLEFVWVASGAWTAEVFEAALEGMLADYDSEREVTMAAKKKAAKAGAAAVAVKNSPYVQRVIEDEELRQNLCQAYESARDAAARLGNGKSPTKQIFDDKKLQKDLKNAAESFRDASVALREAPEAEEGPELRPAAAADRRRAPASRWPSPRACARRCSTPCSAPRRSSSTPRRPRRPRRRASRRPPARPPPRASLLDHRQQGDVPEDRGHDEGRDPRDGERRHRRLLSG